MNLMLILMEVRSHLKRIFLHSVADIHSRDIPQISWNAWLHQVSLPSIDLSLDSPKPNSPFSFRQRCSSWTHSQTSRCPHLDHHVNLHFLSPLGTNPSPSLFPPNLSHNTLRSPNRRILCPPHRPQTRSN